jgi:hypothetical protein
MKPQKLAGRPFELRSNGDAAAAFATVTCESAHKNGAQKQKMVPGLKFEPPARWFDQSINLFGWVDQLIREGKSVAVSQIGSRPWETMPIWAMLSMATSANLSGTMPVRATLTRATPSRAP